jgi:hypothetical protein
MEERRIQDRRRPLITLLDPGVNNPIAHADDYLLMVDGNAVWITPEMLTEGYEVFAVARQALEV